MNPFRSVPTLLITAAALGLPAPAMAGVSLTLSMSVAPPPLPVYVQPDCPGDGYIWTPGYWASGPAGYFWVPGTWVLAPEPGYLWTPAYWGWSDGVYLFHAGYWGPQVGFYGGINYSCGYGGVGYQGGYWERGRFFYNRSVNHVGARVRNVYERPVMNRSLSRVSYNGGSGGIAARPTMEERRAESERHLRPTAEQSRHMEAARQNRQLLASVNRGRPAFAATAHAGDFHGAAPAQAAGDHGDRSGRMRPSSDGPRPRPQEPVVRREPRPAPEARSEARSEARPEARPEPRMERRDERQAQRPAERAPREHGREDHGR